LRIIILDASSTHPNHLLPLMEKISEILSSLSVGAFVLINDLGEIEYIG
jgi:hypothetical protein